MVVFAVVVVFRTKFKIISRGIYQGHLFLAKKAYLEVNNFTKQLRAKFLTW